MTCMMSRPLIHCLKCVIRFQCFIWLSAVRSIRWDLHKRDLCAASLQHHRAATAGTRSYIIDGILLRDEDCKHFPPILQFPAPCRMRISGISTCPRPREKRQQQQQQHRAIPREENRKSVRSPSHIPPGSFTTWTRIRRARIMIWTLGRGTRPGMDRWDRRGLSCSVKYEDPLPPVFRSSALMR